MRAIQPTEILSRNGLLVDAFPSWPFFEEDEIAAAAKVLRSGRVNYWTGDEGRQFESEFAKFVGSNHAVAVANGTVALELALRGLKVGPGDEVITTSRTFIASASCAVSVGARPVFATGRVALRKLPRWLGCRRRYAALMIDRLQKVPGLRIPSPPADVEHAYYKFYGHVEPQKLAEGWSRDRIMAEIVEHGVPCSTGTCSEIYLEKAFPAEWRPTQRLPIAKMLGETSLMFLAHPTLTDAHVHYTCDVIGDVMRQATQSRPQLEVLA